MASIPDPFWLQFSDAVRNWATALGIAAGGIWAAYRFGIQRESETALDIDLRYSSAHYKWTSSLVFLEIILTNKGKVRITANPTPPGGQPAYDDRKEGLGQVIQHSLNVEVKNIKQDLASGTWIDSSKLDNNQTEPISVPINALAGYTDPDKGGVTDFWMEPGESYTLGIPIVMQKGLYLVKVTFIGENRSVDFWQREFLVRVPAQS